jgi:kumamolisin
LIATFAVFDRGEQDLASDMLKPGATPMPILSHDEFEKRYAADAKDIAKIRKFARDNGLSVVHEVPSRRSVMLAGTVAAFNKAFSVSLKTYQHANGTYRGRTGTIKIPTELSEIVEGVFGLDNRPVAKRRGPAKRQVPAATDGARPFNPDQVAKLYNFPPDGDGTGQTIGIIELGGGYRPDDLQAYFSGLGLPTPTVVPVSVDGATNSPSTADSDDGEVVLDIEVAGATAPGAKIVVYFSTNDRASDGFLDALTKAVHDTENNPSIISISWGGPENPDSAGFQAQFDQVLQEAAILGITVCVPPATMAPLTRARKYGTATPTSIFPLRAPLPWPAAVRVCSPTATRSSRRRFGTSTRPTCRRPTARSDRAAAA